MGAEGDLVGSAHVDIHVNAGPGEAELAAFRAKLDRDFAEIDRKKAEAKVKLDAIEFDRTIEKVKTELDNLKRKRASVTIEADTKQLDADIAEAEAELNALTRKKRTIQIDSRQVREAHQAERLLAKERALSERAAIQQAKAEKAITTERERAVTQTIKERSELAKLAAQYEKLRGRQLALEKSSRRVFSSNSIATAQKEARSLERVASEADLVKHKIEKLGGSVEDLDPAIQRNHTLWGRWLSRLGDTSIRIGPITTSLKGLGTGLALLGPLVFELGGGLVSLVGTLGEGLVGAATVGAGALAGLVTSAAGVGFVIGPMIGEFKEVSAAATALHKAELKYGKGSEQAATAQERLNNELHGVSPVAREAFESLGGLKDRWKELTKGARPDVFNAMGQSIKTAQALLPAFASESTKTTQVAAKAWEGWMKSLRSNEAKSILKGIMSDFRASIPGLADGLGSLVAMLGRLSAAGAHFLPGLSNGFAEWANNLEHAVGGGAALQKDVGGLVDQMRDLGHLSQDTGSLLVHIFDASASSGQGLVKSLDNVIKRWDKWTQSAAGKKGLSEFFGDSKTATEDFMSSLSHLTRLLFEFSRATAPVANGLLQIVTWIGDFVSAADDLVGVKTIFQGLGIALAGLWVTGKVMAFAGSIQTVTRALYGMAAGEAAVSAAQSGGLGSLLFGKGKKATTVAETGDDALRSAKQLALFGGAAGTAEAATIGLEGSAGLLAAALAPEVLIPAAAVAGLVGLTLLLKEDRRTIEDVREDYRKAGIQITTSLDESATHVDKYIAAQHRGIQANNAAAEARSHLLKLQRENAPADKVTRAVEELATAEKNQVQTSQRRAVVNKKQIEDQKSLVSGAKARVATAKEEIHALSIQVKNEREMQEQLAGGGEVGNTEKELAKAREDLATATKNVGQAQKQEAVTAIPYERQLKNLKPITQAAEQGLRKLVNTIGIGATKKIGNFVDPKDVQRVAELGNRLTKLGRGSQVKQVAVKSQGADQTIAKLQRLQKQTNRVESSRATIKVGANDTQAQAKLKRLGALSQRIAGTKQTVRILANSNSAEQAINRLRGHLNAVVTKQYKAELKAEDKSGAAANAFHHNMSRVSTQKYQARITAIDDASAKAKTAEHSAQSAGRQKPKINITASNSQALGAISAVQSSLATLHDKTVNVNVVTHKSGGFSGGPATMYYSTFAQGGMTDRELQRANEQAVLRQSGPSRKVTRPTMLVGEQAPNHPEYVIATNPAYRGDNERYLDQAAGHLGYDLIPAFKKGKGASKPKSSGSAAADPGPPPYKKQSKKHWKVHTHTFAPQSVEELNTAEGTLSNLEGKFNAELTREEQEIAHKKRTAWDFAALKGFLGQEATIQGKIIHNLIPNIVQASTKARDRADKELKGPLSKGKVAAARKQANQAEHDYSNLKSPTKKKGESEKDYAHKKAAYEKQKKGLKRNAKEAKAYASRLEDERSDAVKMREEAQDELKEVRHEILVEHETSLMEIETEQENVNDIEANPELAPYYEAPGSAGGGEIPSVGEQTASYNSARENLYKTFGSNVAGPGGLPGVTPGVGGASGPPSPGSFGYLPSATTGAGPGAPYVGAGNAYTGGTPMNSNTVNNYFAAPPPDPHTWTANLQFEIGALA